MAGLLIMEASILASSLASMVFNISSIKSCLLSIADSGSSKTDWLALLERETQSFHSKGLNPVVVSEAFIATKLQATFSNISWNKAVTQIYFYGAGCWNEATCRKLANQLIPLFPKATIAVASDLVGAVKATCGDQVGITCILGTGSNSCWYDGTHVKDQIPSLGYQLGDEGGGAYLGKQLLRHYFYRELPASLQQDFIKKYPITKQEVLHNLHQQQGGNRYLASFAPFLKERQQHPFVNNLLKNSFDEFLTRHVFKYPCYQQVPIHFIGSIAFHFQDILKERLALHKMQLGKIMVKPIQGLERYFREQY